MSDPTGAEGACSGLFCPSHRLRTWGPQEGLPQGRHQEPPRQGRRPREGERPTRSVLSVASLGF
jgi:hypothetical protein